MFHIFNSMLSKRTDRSNGGLVRPDHGKGRKRPFLESLEDRVMLSAVSIDKGYLLVSGSVRNDQIEIEKGQSGLIVKINGKVQSVTDINCGRRCRTLTEVAADRFHIDGDKGNDDIRVATNVTTPGTIVGGDGHDTLAGGSGSTTFFGGPGNDRISWSNRGAANRSHFKVYASGGKDIVRQGRGTYSPKLEGVFASLSLVIGARGTFSGPGGNGQWSTQTSLTFDSNGRASGTVIGTGSGSGKKNGCSGSFTFDINGTASGNSEKIFVGGNIAGGGSGECSGQKDEFTFRGSLTGQIDVSSGQVTGNWNVTSDLGLITGNYTGSASVKSNVAKVRSQVAFGGELPDAADHQKVKQLSRRIFTLMREGKVRDRFKFARVEKQIENLSRGLPILGKTGNVNFVDSRILTLIKRAADRNDSISISEIAAGRHGRGADHNGSSKHYVGRAVDFSHLNGVRVNFSKPSSQKAVVAFLKDLEKTDMFPALQDPRQSYRIGVSKNIGIMMSIAEQWGTVRWTSESGKTALVIKKDRNGRPVRFQFFTDGNTHLHIEVPKSLPKS